MPCSHLSCQLILQLPLSEVFPDDLLAYLGPQLGENPFGNTTPVDEEEIFALFSNS